MCNTYKVYQTLFLAETEEQEASQHVWVINLEHVHFI